MYDAGEQCGKYIITVIEIKQHREDLTNADNEIDTLNKKHIIFALK